jgi:YVTN family beta-propeller protein
MKRVQLFVAAAVVAAAVAVPTAQGLASTLSNPSGPVDPNATLPTTTFVQLIVDSSHHQLFMSTGATTNSLLVTNDSGVVTHTVALAGAEGMTLNNGKLYVAESGTGDIAVVDAKTLKVTHRYAVGAATCPYDVTLAASRYLTYGYGCDRQSAFVGVIDLAAPAPTPSIVGGYTGFYDVIVRAVPNTTTVIVGDRGLFPSSFSIVDVAGVPTITKAVFELPNACDNVQDLAVSPDGHSFAAACYGPYEHDVFSTSDLSQLDSYQTSRYPQAAAFSSNGLEFAGGSVFSYAKTLYVYSTTLGSHVLGLATDFGVSWEVAPLGLGFSSKGDTVFAVARSWPGTGTWVYHLHAISVAATPIDVSVSAPASSPVGAHLLVSGSIAFADGQQHAVQVQVTRRLNGKTTTLPTVTTSLATNVFIFTDTPGAKGTATYTVKYLGDVFNKAGIGNAKVVVH